MKRCRNVVWLFWMTVGACVLAGPAQASLIQNGNFESVTNDKFDFWTYVGSGAYVESSEVISGSHSAGILKGGGASYIYQSPSEAISAFVFECDFAVFPVPENGNRSLNVLLFYHPTENRMINLRVGPNNILQAYDGSGWQPLISVVGPLTARTTTDIGNDGIWNGETPVVNHLMVLGWLGSSTPTYDVILNGISVSGISYFQGGTPSSPYNTIYQVRFQGSSSDKNWLVDNAVFMRIPEPSTGVLLGVGGLLGLAGLFWRRRRQKPLPTGRLAGRPCAPE